MALLIVLLGVLGLGVHIFRAIQHSATTERIDEVPAAVTSKRAPSTV